MKNILFAIAFLPFTALLAAAADSTTSNEAGSWGLLHGEWVIKNTEGEAILTLKIIQLVDELGSGTFSSHPPLCAIISQPIDCLQGQVTDKGLRFVSQNDDAVLVQAHASAERVDNFNLFWSLSTGVGNLGNVNSAALAPFTATLSE